MGPFEQLPEHMEELLADLGGLPLWDFGWGSITTYSVYIVFILVLVGVVVMVVKNKVSLIPKKGPTAAIEATVDYIRKEVGYGVLGHKELVEKHMPFLLTLFFFILASNLVGLIPGAKAATGSFSTALVLALVSFVYFNYYGIKHSGIWAYIKNLCPPGIYPGLNILIWLIELFSLILRVLTLSVRLFANMYAGHIVIGALSIISALFFLPMIQEFTTDNLLLGGASILWVVLLVLMYAMELLVAFIQAYVFTVLQAVYIQLAVSEH
ncbi:MAG: F0F1 ATP synthase subunit A [Coriobacteriales bacterium]|nr:F0F1 ATP synthase subunit A [Coriobacteriales bacterium]